MRHRDPVQWLLAVRGYKSRDRPVLVPPLAIFKDEVRLRRAIALVIRAHDRFLVDAHDNHLRAHDGQKAFRSQDDLVDAIAAHAGIDYANLRPPLYLCGPGLFIFYLRPDGVRIADGQHSTLRKRLVAT